MVGLLKNSALLLAVLLIPSSAQAEPYSPDRASIVQVLCSNGAGTAFKVSEDKYVTAKHVVTADDCRVNGELITDVDRSDPEDFASFKGPKSKHRLHVSCNGYFTQRTYMAIGYGFGWPVTMNMPWISTDIAIDGYQSFIGEGIPGMSGGPVINRSGEVVGIVNMRWPTRSRALRDTPIC